MPDYLVHDPYTLDDIVEELPGAYEASEFLDDAIRQTRAVLKNVFLVGHTELGHHRSMVDAIPDNTLGGEKIKSSATIDTFRAITTNHVRDLAITTAKIADLAVTSAKLAALAITAAKLATDAVEEAKIKDGAVTTNKLGAAAVTAAKLKSDAISDNRAVTSDHIQDNAVTGTRIADKGVAAAKLALASGKILIGDAGGGGEAATVGGDLTVSLVAGVATFALSTALKTFGYALLEEVGDENGGSTSATTWNDRPLDGTWSKTQDSQSMVTLGTKPTFKLALGTYLVRFFSCVHGNVGRHQARLYNVTGTTAVLYGSMGDTASGGGISSGQGILVVSDAAEYYQIEHWTELAVATSGLGLGYGSAVSNLFASIELTRILA